MRNFEIRTCGGTCWLMKQKLKELGKVKKILVILATLNWAALCIALGVFIRLIK